MFVYENKLPITQKAAWLGISLLKSSKLLIFIKILFKQGTYYMN